MAPVVCVLGAAVCFWLFLRTFQDNWRWMTAWVIVGFLIYFGYGYRNSALRKSRRIEMEKAVLRPAGDGRSEAARSAHP